ncbi:DUF1189 family protein [Defluviitalea phaphyphila]|uniref:DUF1189 family protein n=1 Tax=Defluviitalea phaphyphila TaxID=1473580 RepID=UPI000730B0A6|nr:DUF1189 family protein [Defluviitalea phaphyphila]
MAISKIGFFKKINMSITDFSFYKVIIQESTGKAIIYLIFLSMLLSILPSIKIAYLINDEINYIEQKISYFELKNGELNVVGDMPIFIEIYDNLAIIDTTNQTNESILNNFQHKRVFLITNKKISGRIGTQYREILLKNLKIKDFNKDDLKLILFIIKFIVIILCILWVVLSTIIHKLMNSLFINVVGVIVNLIYKANLEYKDIYKIGIYCMTLPSILISIIGQIDFPNLNFLLFFAYYIIVILYLIKAITEIKKENEINLSQNINNTVN